MTEGHAAGRVVRHVPGQTDPSAEVWPAGASAVAQVALAVAVCRMRLVAVARIVKFAAPAPPDPARAGGPALTSRVAGTVATSPTTVVAGTEATAPATRISAVASMSAVASESLPGLATGAPLAARGTAVAHQTSAVDRVLTTPGSGQRVAVWPMTVVVRQTSAVAVMVRRTLGVIVVARATLAVAVVVRGTSAVVVVRRRSAAVARAAR